MGAQERGGFVWSHPDISIGATLLWFLPWPTMCVHAEKRCMTARLQLCISPLTISFCLALKGDIH